MGLYYAKTEVPRNFSLKNVIVVGVGVRILDRLWGSSNSVGYVFQIFCMLFETILFESIIKNVFGKESL